MSAAGSACPTATAVCEIGPATVRRLHPPARDESFAVATQFGALLLASGDDPVLLAGDRPVDVAGCWQAVVADLVGNLAVTGAVELIHPGWWPVTRVRTMGEAARQVVAEVTTRSRREYVHSATVFVEIGSMYVAVGAPGARTVLEDRGVHLDQLLARVYARVAATAGPVCIDAPPGLAGAGELGAALAGRLRSAGRTVQPFCIEIDGAAAPAVEEVSPPPRPGSGPIRWTVALLVVAAMGLVGLLPTRPAEAPNRLTEGAVTVEVPDGWVAHRVTSGPGSVRTQVGPPDDPGTALHITQSRVSGDLEETARTLRDVFAAQPAGVFLDFDAAGRRQGRAAVTYREVRSTHVVEWTILVDNGVRIGIGCQVAVDRDGRLSACDRAVASARGLPA